MRFWQQSARNEGTIPMRSSRMALSYIRSNTASGRGARAAKCIILYHMLDVSTRDAVEYCMRKDNGARDQHPWSDIWFRKQIYWGSD